MLYQGRNQRSKNRGKLYIVATPIGNLEDLTLRALKILKQVPFIACEDTRHTRKLLNRYHLKKKLISYYHPKETQKVPKIIHLLDQGRDVALVSDAGTPGVSDPGYPLIRKAIREGMEIVPVPGASALTAALSSSGLPTHRFLFIGFPPSKKEATRKLLHSLIEEKGTLIFYLPTRKLLLFLSLIHEIMGNRQVVVAREMTKIHEEFIRGPAQKLREIIQNRKLKGEVTLLVEGRPKK
ncbi:MAG: 16S rRNA (cytidine(1402)-2'-O)-methyltransferase [Candidatus Aminicenantes bacterium]